MFRVVSSSVWVSLDWFSSWRNIVHWTWIGKIWVCDPGEHVVGR